MCNVYIISCCKKNVFLTKVFFNFTIRLFRIDKQIDLKQNLYNSQHEYKCFLISDVKFWLHHLCKNALVL